MILLFPKGMGGGGGVVVPGLFKFVPITNRKEVCCHFSTIFNSTVYKA